MIWSVLGALALLAGLVGCVLPVLPGPALAFLSLIFVSLAESWEAYSVTFLVVAGITGAVVTGLDYVLPSAVSKKRGASRAGSLGSIVGMIAGIFLFPPFGIFIGAFVGAVAGEFLFGPNRKGSLKAGWGVLLGSLLSMAIKLGYSGVVGFFFVRAAVS